MLLAAVDLNQSLLKIVEVKIKKNLNLSDLDKKHYCWRINDDDGR
jgi:hypothetical protein